jgi:hypothetical protein
MRKRLVLLLAVTSCHGACGNKTTAADDSGSDAAIASTDAEALAPARCNTLAHRASLGSPLDVGEAIITNDGFAIGLVREKNVFSVALVSSDLANVTFVDIGPARGENGPPQPFLWDKSVYVAWIDSGALRLGRIESGKVAMIGEAIIDVLAYSAKDPGLQDIPARDVVTSGDHGAVVWDFADPSRGHVRFLSFTKSGFDHPDGGIPYVEVAPVSSDADSPRLAPRAGGGYWAVWVARKDEPTTDASTIEGPGETPTFRWLEAAPLDAQGTRVGAVAKLVPEFWHAGGYDLATTREGAEVVVRDATEEKDEGCTLGQITLSDKVDGPAALAVDVGRAEPDLVTTAIANGGSVSWVVTPDLNDATRIIPLRKIGAQAQLPSVEPLLRSARALALRSANSGVELLAMHALSVAGSPDQAEIMLISCLP